MRFEVMDDWNLAIHTFSIHSFLACKKKKKVTCFRIQYVWWQCWQRNTGDALSRFSCANKAHSVYLKTSNLTHIECILKRTLKYLCDNTYTVLNNGLTLFNACRFLRTDDKINYKMLFLWNNIDEHWLHSTAQCEYLTGTCEGQDNILNIFDWSPCFKNVSGLFNGKRIILGDILICLWKQCFKSNPWFAKNSHS